MTKTTLIAFASMFSIAATAQTSYSNGALSTGVTTKSGLEAPEDHTWSELQNVTGNTTQSNLLPGFEGHYTTSNGGKLLYDDFTVPFGEQWSLSDINFFCYQDDFLLSTPPVDVVRVRIWLGDPALPSSTIVFGNLTTNRINTAQCEDQYMLRIENSQYPAPGVTPVTTKRIWKINATVNKVLNPGVYWIEFQVHGANNGVVMFPTVTTEGSRGNDATNNARQKDVSSNTWNALIDLGKPLSSPDIAQDLPFTIIYNDPAAGIEDAVAHAFSIYPNPVSNVFSIKNTTIEGDARLMVYDVKGVLVLNQVLAMRADSEAAVDASSLTPGVYLVKIADSNGAVYNSRFVKN